MMEVIRFITRLVNEPFDLHFKPWLANLVFIGYVAGLALAIYGLYLTRTPNV